MKKPFLFRVGILGKVPGNLDDFYAKIGAHLSAAGADFRFHQLGDGVEEVDLIVVFLTKFRAEEIDETKKLLNKIYNTPKFPCVLLVCRGTSSWGWFINELEPLYWVRQVEGYSQNWEFNLAAEIRCSLFNCLVIGWLKTEDRASIEACGKELRPHLFPAVRAALENHRWSEVRTDDFPMDR